MPTVSEREDGGNSSGRPSGSPRPPSSSAHGDFSWGGRDWRIDSAEPLRIDSPPPEADFFGILVRVPLPGRLLDVVCPWQAVVIVAMAAWIVYLLMVKIRCT